MSQERLYVHAQYTEFVILQNCPDISWWQYNFPSSTISLDVTIFLLLRFESIECLMDKPMYHTTFQI